MNSDNKYNKLFSIKYTMKPADIMTFVSGLHDIQSDMIEELVRRAEAKGFPEATVVIKHIMEK